MVDNLYHLRKADQRLALKMEVLACWTANGFSYQSRAVVIRLKRDRVTVKLLHSIGLNGGFPGGKIIEIPRFADQTRWSSRNCVHPVAVTNNTHREAV